MPLYEYRCKECGHLFEKMISFSQADKLPECPNCKGSETQKMVSMFASKGTTASFNTSASSGCQSGGRFT